MVTVIIPYYKNASSIKRTLKSVLHQSYAELEILVINDCSPDVVKLEKIVSELNDIRIQVIHHAHNLNGSAARNTGMNNAKGIYLAFLDADDEWSKNHIEMFLKMVSSAKEKKICFYCKSLIKTSDHPDLILPKTAKSTTSSVAKNLFIEDGFIQSSGLFISSDCPIRWNESLKRHQDYDFLFRLEKAGYEFQMSAHLGVTIHWEGNDIRKKGGTWNYSLNYVNEHGAYFNKRTRSNFIYKNVIKPLLKERKIIKGINLYFTCNCWRHLPLKMQVEFIDLLLFGRHLIIPILANLKK